MKDGLAQWISDQRDDIDLYSSFFRYYTNDPNVGPVLAGFGMDFDSLTNPEKARKEAFTVCRYLMDRFSLKLEDLSVCFSGSKGFHIFVNHACFGIEPYYFLPQVFKSMAREFIHELNLKTLDLAIYDRRRLIRLPKSRHGGSQLYKTPLSLYELEHSTVTTIKTLAVKPRSLFPPKPHEVSEKGSRWLQQHKKTFQQALASKREEFTDRDFQFKGLNARATILI